MADEANSSGDEGKKDSPAFRLRPRRNIPKSEPPKFAQGRRYGRISPKISPYSALSGNKLRYNHLSLPTKRKLFNVSPKNVTRNREPLVASNFILSGLNLSPFAERISPEQLNENERYENKFISMKIVHVFERNEDGILSLFAQDADEWSSLINPEKSLIHINLYDIYGKMEKIKVGKYVEILKFLTTELKYNEEKFSINEHSLKILPYSIILKEESERDNFPVISIKTHFEPSTDPSKIIMSEPENQHGPKLEHEPKSVELPQKEMKTQEEENNPVIPKNEESLKCEDNSTQEVLMKSDDMEEPDFSLTILDIKTEAVPNSKIQ